MNKPPGPPAATSPAAQNATEYIVRVPKASRRKFNMMRFHQALGVDFKTWSLAKMERENNQKEFRSLEDEMPKFGAGSEYGRDQREEARRKKYGINMRRYVSENQPWLLTVGGKTGKKFKGIREGGVSENSSWYVFMQGKDGAFEAFPVEEWYNFKMIQRYNTLTAEEAEEQFEKRDKIMNFHALRWEKKLKQDAEDPDEEKAPGSKKTKSTKSMLLSELDDWMSSGDSEEPEEDEEEAKPKKKAKGFKKTSSKRNQKGGSKRKNDEGDSDDDCFEESDEYDEMAEHEYISSDSSDSDCEDDEVVRKELAGVDEADALKKMLNSDESSEDEEKKKEKEEEDKNKDEENEGEDKEKEKKKKKKKKKDKKERDSDGNSSSDDEKQPKKKKKPGEVGEKDESGKRKMKNQAGDGTQNKKPRPADAANGEGASGAGAAAAIPPPGSESGVTEEAIRRYLMRKPMTTIELLQKFKNKKTGLSSDQLVRAIAAILKRINPIKQMVKGKMYLSIKS